MFCRSCMTYRLSKLDVAAGLYNKSCHSMSHYSILYYTIL